MSMGKIVMVGLCRCRLDAAAKFRDKAGGETSNMFAQGDHFQVLRAVGPIVMPADDDVAPFRIVAVIAEVAAFVLEFDGDGLPVTGAHVAPGFAVGVRGA